MGPWSRVSEGDQPCNAGVVTIRIFLLDDHEVVRRGGRDRPGQRHLPDVVTEGDGHGDTVVAHHPAGLRARHAGVVEQRLQPVTPPVPGEQIVAHAAPCEG